MRTLKKPLIVCVVGLVLFVLMFDTLYQVEVSVLDGKMSDSDTMFWSLVYVMCMHLFIKILYGKSAGE